MKRARIIYHEYGLVVAGQLGAFPVGELVIDRPPSKLMEKDREAWEQAAWLYYRWYGPMGEIARGKNRNQLIKRLQKELSWAELEATAYVARLTGMPAAARVHLVNRRWPKPEEVDILQLFGVGNGWSAVITGGRSPIVIALPPEWGSERLSAQQALSASRAGLPVFGDSVHGRGLLILEPDGCVWRPPLAPVVYWNGRRRTWQPSYYPADNPLRCGYPSPHPGGELNDAH